MNLRYGNNNDTFSFLPQDTIDPAIQNLGRTLGGINQAKISQQEGLQKQFQSLLDISYENMLANHQTEVMKDWDKFKSNAINVFKSASEAGTPINMNEYAKVMKEHNEVVRKAEYAKQLKQDYYKTMAEAAKLDAANKLDPESKKALDDWKNQGGNLYELPVPSSLIQTQYSPMEIATIEKGMYNGTTLLKKTYKDIGGGKQEIREFYDPQNVAKIAIDRVKTDPDFAKFVQKNYGTLDKYVAEKQAIYDKEYESIKMPSQNNYFNNFSERDPSMAKLSGTPISGGTEYDVSRLNKPFSGEVTLADGSKYTVDNGVRSKVIKNDDGTYQEKIVVLMPDEKKKSIFAKRSGGTITKTGVEITIPSTADVEEYLRTSKVLLDKDKKVTPKGGSKKTAQQYGL